MTTTATTQRDVALDVAAALGMYEGLCGSDSTTIAQVDHEPRDVVRLTLSDGSIYDLRIREVTPRPTLSRDELLALGIEELELSVKTYNVLKRVDVNTLRDLLGFDYGALRRWNESAPEYQRIDPAKVGEAIAAASLELEKVDRV